MATRFSSSRICILDLQEAEHYAATGELPSCSHHPHINKNTATEFTQTLLYFDGKQRRMAAYWCKGKRAIVFHEGPSWRVKCGLTGVWGWQLVAGGGAR